MTLSRSAFYSTDVSGESLPPVISSHLEDLPFYEEIASHHSSSSSITEETFQESGEQGSNQRVFRHILKRLWREDLPGKEHAERHLRDKYRRNCKPKTLLGTLTTLKLFLGFLKKAGRTRLEEITREDLEAYVEHEQDRGLKIVSVRTRLGIVNAFVRFMIEAGVIHADVLARKIRIKLPQLLPRAMRPEDVKRLLSVIAHTRDRALILVLLRTGMRIGELLSTKLRDVHLEEQKILIYEGEKNRVGRVVYFSDDARDALEAWVKKRNPQREFVFYAPCRNSISYPAVRMKFVKYLEKAGLTDKGYTLHCLRHTCATELLNAGMRLECLQQLLGHTSLEVTRRYARLTDKTREEEYFRAMAIIEREESNGQHQLDRELPAVLEEEELLSSYREELPEYP